MEETLKLDVRSGGIKFSIPENYGYDDQKNHKLVDYSDESGSVSIKKDSDNKLKLSHFAFGKGRHDLEYDVSDLVSSEPHIVSAKWNSNSNEYQLNVE
ncbi:MAG: hypothetical protein K8R67_02605 [Desulfobacteraceae bacterium]|nr:hypothetical protein [Desulfobacteraceae bacterium]